MTLSDGLLYSQERGPNFRSQKVVPLHVRDRPQANTVSPRVLSAADLDVASPVIGSGSLSETALPPSLVRSRYIEGIGSAPGVGFAAGAGASIAAATGSARAVGSASGVGKEVEAERSHIEDSEPMATSDELAEAKIAAAEARTDTKIARIEGKLDLVLSKLDAAAGDLSAKFIHVGDRLTEVRNDVRADYAATRTNLWVVFCGILALIVAVALLFPTFFDMGSKIRDMVEKEVHTQRPQ